MRGWIRFSEVVLTVAAIAFAILSLATLVRTARSNEMEFESRINESRYFMHVADAVKDRLGCMTALGPTLENWNRQSPLSPVRLNADLPRWDGPGEAILTLIPQGLAKALLEVRVGQMTRSIPLLLAQGCELDQDEAAEQLGGNIRISSRCEKPTPVGRLFRCTAGKLLARRLFPLEFACCPYRH